MTGMECTPEQQNERKPFKKEYIVQHDQLVRLLAWYGALRYISARDGTGGTLENPGAFTVNGSDFPAGLPPTARDGGDGAR